MTQHPQQPDPMPPTSVDPITAILLSVTRIEQKLAGALETLQRHDVQLSGLATTVTDHGNRLVALETRDQADDRNQQGTRGSKALVVATVASIAAVAMVVLNVLLAVRGVR